MRQWVPLQLHNIAVADPELAKELHKVNVWCAQASHALTTNAINSGQQPTAVVAPGGGTSVTVKDSGASVSTTITTFDFTTGIQVSESPTGEANMSVKLSDFVGSIDHGSIAGLADDDHAQYILVAGTRAFTGDQSMGGFGFTNVDDVRSVDGVQLELVAEDSGHALTEAFRINWDMNDDPADDDTTLSIGYTDSSNTFVPQYKFRYDSGLSTPTFTCEGTGATKGFMGYGAATGRRTGFIFQDVLIRYRIGDATAFENTTQVWKILGTARYSFNHGGMTAGNAGPRFTFYSGNAATAGEFFTIENPLGTNLFQVDWDGNVGIGTATPPTNATKLTIEDGLTFKEISAPTADLTYGKIWTETNNELFFQSGDGATHLVHGDAFSEIWFHGASTVEVAISTQNVFTKIDSFTVVGHEDDLSNVIGSASTNDLTLSAIAGGEYELSFHTSMTATGGADKEMLICLGITLATPKDITDVTDDLVTPIVITSIAHGLENGDMVEIVGVLGNTAANGSFMVGNKAPDTFEIVDLSAGATTGNGDFDAGSPTGDVTIVYPGNMVVHREVRGATLGAASASGLRLLADSDVLAVYVANLDGTTNLTIAAISFDAFRIGD